MNKSRDAFRTISEVADWLETPAHVLRFWESKFTQVKPVKRAGGRRYYRPADMALLGGIKKLLHEDGMTIKGVQKVLREKGVKHVAGLSMPVEAEEEMMVEERSVASAGGRGGPVMRFNRPDPAAKKPSMKVVAPSAEPAAVSEAPLDADAVEDDEQEAVAATVQTPDPVVDPVEAFAEALSETPAADMDMADTALSDEPAVADPTPAAAPIAEVEAPQPEALVDEPTAFAAEMAVSSEELPIDAEVAVAGGDMPGDAEQEHAEVGPEDAPAAASLPNFLTRGSATTPMQETQEAAEVAPAAETPAAPTPVESAVEDDMPTEDITPGPLTHLARLPRLTKAQQSQIAPLARRLREVAERHAAPRV